MNIQKSCDLTEVICWQILAKQSGGKFSYNVHPGVLMKFWIKGWLDGFNEVFTVIVVVVYSHVIASNDLLLFLLA